MIYAILSDIHANLQAFEAVLTDLENLEQRPDALIYLGDVVGYGAQPVECVEKLNDQSPILWMKGNHELIFLANGDTTQFPGLDIDRAAIKTNQYARDQFDEDVRGTEWLEQIRQLPVRPQIRDGIVFVHSDLFNPPWGKLDQPHHVRTQLLGLKRLHRSICMYGHIHRSQIICFEKGNHEDRGTLISTNNLREGATYAYSQWIELSADRYWYVCVGSVGQPRDGDRRAAYALVEVNGDRVAIQLRRVCYDWEQTAECMKEAGWETIAPQALNRIIKP